MSVYSLWGLRRIRILKSHWPMDRFGVLQLDKLPWDVERLWNDWSFAVGQKFRWDSKVDVWSFLQHDDNLSMQLNSEDGST
mmetsp:Transcript_902/g.1254  ORF Transcript_902/g.1254 Transcript_902/m.1254 type:complete len:81 (+) Transcript_902:33-275(+)